jgi:hypothetical protein
MLLEITNTTDGNHIGTVINSESMPIVLDADELFLPDRVWQTGPGTWRLANSNYVVDAKE